MRPFFLIAFVFLSVVTTKACDICGCGVGGNYIGILPDFNKKIAGLRYRYNNLQTHVGPGGATTYLTTREIFHTAEIWGGWNIRRNFRIMVTLPYNFTEKTNQAVTKNKSGLGDISLAGFYQLLNKKSMVSKDRLLIQSLWLGGGIKLASGKYNPVDKSNSNQNANLFQLGTGSTDLNLYAMYDIRLQDIGFNINSSYKINTANKYDYSYGNKFSLSTQLYHKFRIGNKSNIAPNAGLFFESAQKDTDGKISVDASGGNMLAGGIGTEFSYKKIMLGFNWQAPISQQLASGIVKARNKMMLHTAFGF